MQGARSPLPFQIKFFLHLIHKTFKKLKGDSGREKNVVVLTERRKEIPENASSKTIKSIDKQNKRIDKRNSDRISTIKKDLEEYYNQTNSGKGAVSEDGDRVQFKFNVTGLPDFDKEGMTRKEINKKYEQISRENGINGMKGGYELTAGAFIVTNEGALGSAYADATGNIGRENSNSPRHMIAYEIVHGLNVMHSGLTDDGVRSVPPEPVSSQEVSIILKEAYEKKKN